MRLDLTALSPSTVAEVQKGQNLRLWDVFALGPWLIYLAARKSRLARAERLALAIAGAGIIVYNGRNYLANRKRGTA